MKNILTLFVLVAFVTITSCKKENVETKPIVADLSFSLYDFKIPTDTTITGISYQNTLSLNGNYTWTLVIGDATSNGTYSWTPINSEQAKIKFNINNWETIKSDIAFSNKLRDVFLKVDICGFLLPAVTNLNFWDSNCGTFLRTDKK